MSWRRILLLTLVCFVAMVGVSAFALRQLAAPQAFVRKQLEAVVRAPFDLGDVALDLATGAVQLTDLVVQDPARPGATLLRIDAVQIELDLAAAGAGVVAHRVAVDGMALDLGPRLPTPAELLATPPAAAPTAPSRLPAVTLRRGRCRYHPGGDAPPLELEQLELQLGPGPEPGSAVLTGSAHLPALGVPLQCRGELRPDGSFRLQVEAAAWRLDTARLQALAAQFHLGLDQWHLADRPLHPLQVTAAVADLRLTWTGGGSTRGEATFEVALQELAVVTPALPPLLESAAARVAFHTGHGGELRAELTQHSSRGDLTVRVAVRDLANTPSVNVEARGRSLRVDADAVAAMRLFPLGARLMDALGPKGGHADIDLFLHDPHTPPNDPNSRVEFDLQLHDVAMAYHGFGEGRDQIGFPLPLVHGSGRVRMRDDLVHLENLRAEADPAAGGGQVQLTGVVAPKLPTGEDTVLHIHASGMSFGPPLREALQGLLHDGGALYDRLGPRGRADVEVHLLPRQQLAGGWSAVVRPQAAAVCWQGFPYPLDGLGGQVLLRADAAEFALTGHHGAGELELRGTIPLQPDDADAGDAFSAVVTLRDVAIDDALRSAVTTAVPDLDQPWRESAACGRLSGTARVWRTASNAPLQHDLELQLVDAAFVLPCAPWRIDQVCGELLVAADGEFTRVDCNALRGRLGHGGEGAEPAPFTVLGRIERGRRSASDLTFVVTDLALDPTLGTTLEAWDVLPQGLWAQLVPSGSVDFACRHVTTPTTPPRTTLDLQLVDAASAAPMLPYPLTQLQGRVQAADGALWFQSVRGQLGGNRIQCEQGRISSGSATDPRTAIACVVRAPDVPIDPNLARLFPARLGAAITACQPSGRAAIDHLSLRFLLPTRGPDGRDWPLATEVAGALRLRDVGVQLGSGPDAIAVRDINGQLHIEPSTVTAEGGDLRCTLQHGAMRLFGQPLVGVAGAAAVGAEQVTIETLTATLHQGTLGTGTPGAPALRYLLPAPAQPAGRLSGDLQFADIEVAALLRECGWQQAPYRGRASGRFRLGRLDGADLTNAEASGQLLVDRADLGEVPLFTAIYAQLPAPQRPRFDRLATAWRLRQGRVEFSDLALRSNLLGATGSGWLDLDGHLDVRLQLDNLLGPSADPVLMPLIDLLTQGIVRFHLYGHLRQVQTQRRWLNERSPVHQPAPPMPPHQKPLPILDS